MRTWERVTYQERCGRCGLLLERGMAIQVITRNGLKRKLLRCAICADSAVPPDLPESPEVTSVEERVKQLASVAPKTRGELKAMAREWMPFREPGEDG